MRLLERYSMCHSQYLVVFRPVLAILVRFCTLGQEGTFCQKVTKIISAEHTKLFYTAFYLTLQYRGFLTPF